MLKSLAILVISLSLYGCASTVQQTDYTKLKTSNRFGTDLIAQGTLDAGTIAVIPAKVVIRNTQTQERWSDDEAMVFDGNFPVHQEIYYKSASSSKPEKHEISSTSVSGYYKEAVSLQEIYNRNISPAPKPITVTYANMSAECRRTAAETLTQNSERLYDGQWDEVLYTQAVVSHPELSRSAGFDNCMKDMPRYVALASFEGQQLMSSHQRRQVADEHAARGTAGRILSDLADTYSDPATWLVGYNGHVAKKAAEQARNSLSGETSILVVDRLNSKIVALMKSPINYGSYESIPQNWFQSIIAINPGLENVKKARNQPPVK